MHSAQQSYDTNGWNSIQNGHGHYRQQQMPYHYPQTRGTRMKPPQIETQGHSRSNPHPQRSIPINQTHSNSHHVSHINQVHHSHSNPNPQCIPPITHKYNRNHSHSRNAKPNPTRPTRTASYSSGFTDYRPKSPNMQYNHPMPQISEPRSDANHYNNYRRSHPQTRSNHHAQPMQPSQTHKTRTQSVTTYNKLPPPTMHSMHKFASNDSSNHSLYSPESIRSQPPPQRENVPMRDMKKNKSFTLYHDEAPKTKQSRSRTLTSIRGLSDHPQSAWNQHHNNRHNQVKSEIMVFSPKNNELNLPHNIGLADFKQSEYMDMEMEYYNNKSVETKRRRAETAPAQPYYGGFMRSVEENVEYTPHSRGGGARRARPVQHLPNHSYIGSPINMFSPTLPSPTAPQQHNVSATQAAQYRNAMQYNNSMQYRQNPPRLLASVTSQHQATEESYSYETVSESTDEYDDESGSSTSSEYSDSRSVYSDEESGSSISEEESSYSHSHSQSSQESESMISASKTPTKTPRRKRKRKRRSRRKKKKSTKHSKKKKKSQHHKKTARKTTANKPRMRPKKSEKKKRSNTKQKNPQGSGYILNNHVTNGSHVKEEKKRKSGTIKKKIASHLQLTGNKKVYEKSKKTAILLRSILKRQMLFIGLDDEMLDGLVDKMYEIQCNKNECLMQQNEAATALFVIESGKFIEIRNNKVIAFATAKSMIGEGALLYSQARRATLKAQSDSVAWALDCAQFMKLRQNLTAKNIKSHLKKVRFLRRISLFADMHTMDLVDIASAIRAILYRKGANIITEGEESSHFFIVYKGNCEAFEISKETTKLERKYTSGDYFGAHGILNKEARCLRVTATSDDVICYVLNAVEFAKFLPFKKNEQYSPLTSGKFVNKLGKLDDFEHIAKIGAAQFGEICLVLHRQSAQSYALKRIEKEKVISSAKAHAVEHIRNERAILSSLANSFCVTLYGTYSDDSNVYLLQEAVLGGQVFYLLKFNKRFPEKTARFYAACVVLAFEHIHSKNVIYRDLKPQNLLVQRNGYCKLVDFGCSKLRNDTCTLCGRAEYLSPEVIQCAHESFTIDWWTLGVFIYEMIIGTVPFRDDLSVKMYEKILSSSVDFPSKIRISRTGKDLITSLLRKHPYKRLGCGHGKNGSQQIKNHQWFQAGFNWTKMAQQQIKPPYFPNIANKKDITNFERFQFDPAKQRKNQHAADDIDPAQLSWCDDF